MMVKVLFSKGSGKGDFMGLIRKLMRKYPRLRDKESRVKIILDIIFYALFFTLIWASRPIYVDYCSSDLSLNVSNLKNITPFNESMLCNTTKATDGSVTVLGNLTPINNTGSILNNMNPYYRKNKTKICSLLSPC